jgi:hypothetical protein
MDSDYVQINGDTSLVACPGCDELLNGKKCSICGGPFVAGQGTECVKTDSGAREHYHKECYENATADGSKDRGE